MVPLLLWTIILPLQGAPSGSAVMKPAGEEGTCKVNPDGSNSCDALALLKLDPKGAEERLRKKIIAGGGIAEVKIGESFAIKDEDGKRIRGLLAASDISSGQVLTRIPAELIFRSDIDAKRHYDRIMKIVTETFAQPESHSKETCARIALAAGLIYERRQLLAGKPSKIADYIHLLTEKGPPNMASFTGPEREALELENSVFMNLREMTWAVLHQLNEEGGDFENLSSDEIKWGFSHSLSRGVQDPEKEEVLQLVPIQDMANHDDVDMGHEDHFNAYTEFEKDGSAVMRASKRIPKGEEITIFYGDWSKIQMVAVYGFMNDYNEKSSIHVRPKIEDFYQDECKEALEHGIYLPGTQGIPNVLHICEGHGSRLVGQFAEFCDKKLERWDASSSALDPDPPLLQALEERGSTLVLEAMRADLRVLRRCAASPGIGKVDTLPGKGRGVTPGSQIR